jgi:hypothetical protein
VTSLRAGGRGGWPAGLDSGGEQRSSSEACLARVGLKDKAQTEGSFGMECDEACQQPRLKRIVSEILNGWKLLKYPEHLPLPPPTPPPLPLPLSTPANKASGMILIELTSDNDSDSGMGFSMAADLPVPVAGRDPTLPLVSPAKRPRGHDRSPRSF